LTPASLGPALHLANIRGPLPHALDLTEGQAPRHCVRCACIGTLIGDALGLNAGDMDDLYYTLLLKVLGCSSNAAHICELYLANDLTFKRDSKNIDSRTTAALRFVFAQTGLKSGLSERFRSIVNILQNGGDIVRILIKTRCHRGAAIAARMRFSAAVQDGFRDLDEHWDCGGCPVGLTGAAIPLNAEIALLAQIIDISKTDGGRDAVRMETIRRAGTWFDPALVATFTHLSHDPDFWADLTSPGLEMAVFALPAFQRSNPVNDGYLDDIAQAFSDVVDAKSSFSADHSSRVTLYADMIAEQMGYTLERRRWLRRAALLHDLGKLEVSNQVLDKPGKLVAAEWASVRAHTDADSAILTRISAFANIAHIARDHHERLDGTGHPNGRGADQLTQDVRIVTVPDVFVSLSAERPYRAAMPIDEVLAILDSDRGTVFDPDCIDALRTGLGALAKPAH
jgi:HD-GYP domain-containing protein (c-di-GMP phosphodiesterase class II)